MNIKELQTKNEVDKSTIRHLKSGVVPSFTQVTTDVKKAFKHAVAGLPKFKPLFAKKYDCSSPGEYNFMLNMIYDDLVDLYDIDNHVNNEILSSFSYYDSEKSKIESLINEAQNKVDNMNTGIREGSSTGFFSDNFDDFTKIDFVGSADRGIPRTTSFVDLLTGSVSNDTLTDDAKIPLKNCEVKFDLSCAVIGNEVISDIEKCINDNLNEAWSQRVTTDNENGLVSRLTIELPNETDMTTVRFELLSSRKAYVKLTTFNQNKKKNTYKKVETSSAAEWNFKRNKVKVLVFEISKTEPDSFSGINYDYYIGAKNISAYNNFHLVDSTFVTKPMKIDRMLTEIALNVKQSTPPDTMIKYYIGIDNLDNQISWTKVNNKQVTDLGILSKAIVNIDKDYTEKYGEKRDDGGYILGRLKNIPAKSFTKLYIGNNMWERRIVDLIDGEEFNPKALFLQTDPDYIKMDTVDFKHDKDTANAYTTNIKCSSPKAIKAKILATSESSDIVVYVNGAKVEKGKENYIVRLSAGWNKIEVLYLSKEESTLSIDAYFGDVADVVRAKKDALTELPEYDLLYNIHRETYDFYSVNYGDVIVNFDPNDISLEATVEYQYPKNPEVFKNFHLRLMAILTADARDVTPKIENYRLTTL